MSKSKKPCKKIVYVDIDNMLVGFFCLMTPMPSAVEAIHTLSAHFDFYILSTSPWLNETAMTDKLAWVKKIFRRK